MAAAGALLGDNVSTRLSSATSAAPFEKNPWLGLLVALGAAAAVAVVVEGVRRFRGGRHRPPRNVSGVVTGVSELVLEGRSQNE